MSKQELNILEIMNLIPHRYPMLLVDKICDIISDESCCGIKNITINEPYFNGHFPGQPIMPGVLIVEAMAQTAGILVCNNLEKRTQTTKIYFISIQDTRFRKPVIPGDVLKMYVQKLQQRKNIWKFKGLAKVGENIHAEATFSATIINE